MDGDQPAAPFSNSAEQPAEIHGTCEQNNLHRLPSNVLALLIQQLSVRDQGSLRLVCSELNHGVDHVVEVLHVAAPGLRQLANLLSKLRGLKELGLSAATLFKSYAELRSEVSALTQSLQPLTSLTSLVVSTAAAQQLGALRWAHLEAQHAIMPAVHTNTSCGLHQGTPGPLDKIFWVPDWLATAPNLQQLVMKAPEAISCSSSRVWLWLHAQPWSSKLTCLQLHGVPLSDTTHIPLRELSRLQGLHISGSTLTSTAAEVLLQQLSGCPHLSSLVLSSNGMSLLPEHGWEELAGLKELDVSRNMLQELPVGLCSLLKLTSLQVHHNSLTTLDKSLMALSNLVAVNASHNWLSGCRDTLPGLLTAWKRLEVLILDNVSDKRGELALPAELAACKSWQKVMMILNVRTCPSPATAWNLVYGIRHLRELSVSDNFGLNQASLLSVLPNCKALRVVRLSELVVVTGEQMQDNRLLSRCN